jgi:hypothetical protein
MLRVTKATPLDGHVLALEFSDGVSGQVDCSFLLAGGLGADLRDPAYFRQVAVDEGLRTVVWPNGLDPSPELLYRALRADGRVGVPSAA